LLAACPGFAGCSKFAVLDAIVPRGGSRTLDVAYGPDPRQRLDVHRPAPSASPAPVLVFFYGGDWRTGSKANYRFVAQAFASHGYLVVIPDYRLHPAVTFPAFVEDAAAAVRWTRDHADEYGGDPHRLFLAGHSAGAHLAAMLTLDARYLDAVGVPRDAIRATAGLSGPYNFKLRDQDAPVFASRPRHSRRRTSSRSASSTPPRRRCCSCRVPGTPPSTPRNADMLEAAIRDAGGRVEKVSYAKQGHASIALSLAWGFRWLAPTLRDTLAFFAEHGSATDGRR
jgi:acetyl esterase/lipase